jgi:hypothetical protein
MNGIGIFFGTDTGRTRRVAKLIAPRLGDGELPGIDSGSQSAGDDGGGAPDYAVAANASWNATLPCGTWPSKDRERKTSGGTPSSTRPGRLSKPNFR